MESSIAQTGCGHVDEEGVLLAGIYCSHCWKLALSKWTLGIWVAFTAFKPLGDGNPWLVQNSWGRFYRNAAVLLAGAGVCSMSSLGHGWVRVAATGHPWELPPASWAAAVHCLASRSRGQAWLAESHCIPPSPAVPSPAQGPSALPLGMWQEATEQENDCLIIARCIIVVYILPLNYYVLTAAGPSPQLFRWCKSVRFHFHQQSAPDLHNLMV